VRIVFFGSGEFGLPTLGMLLREHEVVLGVTQPDRPAGRGREQRSTPVGRRLEDAGVALLRTADANVAETVERVRAAAPEALVVIDFGQKLSSALLHGHFAINLHGSLLPRHRGAAPVNWAILSGDAQTGVSVIALASRMDAGELYAERAVVIDSNETAGELHDRLAALGPSAIGEVLAARQQRRVIAKTQSEREATRAPKLSRADAWLRFDAPAVEVRRRVHGLSPWPGCAVRLGAAEVKLLRAAVVEPEAGRASGELDSRGAIQCAEAALLPVEVQPAGGRRMPYASYQLGHQVGAGHRVGSVVPPPPAESGAS
jgi:methionyl-tRNA formyltransferase